MICLVCLSCQSKIKKQVVSLKKNVIRVSVRYTDGETGYGFGFITGEGEDLLYFVTAKHVVNGNKFNKEPSKITVHFYESFTPVLGKLVHASLELPPESQNDLDLALLSVNKPDGFEWEQQFAASTGKENNTVQVIGQGETWDITSRGKITRIDRDILRTNIQEIASGTSGAPLVNRSGIVGMITEDSNLDTEAISLIKIQQALNAHGKSEYFSPQIGYWNEWGQFAKNTWEEVEGFVQKGTAKSTNPLTRKNKIASLSTLNPGNYRLIQGGYFTMGDIFNEGESDESPVYESSVADFFVYQYEVSNMDFQDFLNEIDNGSQSFYDSNLTNAKIKLKNPIDGVSWSVGNNFRKRPVIGVSWHGAIAFCNWLSEKYNIEPAYVIRESEIIWNKTSKGYRLPTEEEWEYAARNWGEHVRFGNGQDTAAPQRINYEASIGNQVVNIDKMKPNDLGLYHMSGNVSEWCWDAYLPNSYELKREGKTINESEMKQLRVVRAGNFTSQAAGVRISNRGGLDPYSHSSMIGFRIVKSR